MKSQQKFFVSVDCVDVDTDLKVNFIQEVESFAYWHKDYETFKRGQKVAEDLACLRARKHINSLPSYKVMSTRVIPSTTLGWKNN